MAGIDAVLFDKDGTLFDFRKSWGGWAANFLGHLTPDLAEQQRLGAVIAYDAADNHFLPDSPVISATPSEIAAILAPHYSGLTADQLEIQMNLLAADAPMAPAVPLRPLLMALRSRGLRLGVATNDGQAPAQAHMQNAGVSDLFDLILG
ncbi:MAG: HAD family hydrolase, partial [Paracoccaceae bacterium]